MADTDKKKTASDDADEYAAAYRREKKARQRAEAIIEEKNRDIHRLREELVASREQVQSHQETLLQADKLKSVGQLAAGITHEINNPLAYISSNFNLLDDYFATLTRVIAQQQLMHRDEIEPALRKEIGLILEDTPEIFSEVGQGLERITNIVANVKRFARKNARKRALSDINLEVRAALKLVEQQLKPDTVVAVHLGELPLVSCNVAEVGQVIVNLIMNADQAGPPRGGPIEVRTRRKAAERLVEIAVIDKGCGIPEDLLEQIFEPFFTTKPVGVGTGIGLAVSHSIIEEHEGRLTVESVPDEGTTFFITLPID